MDYSYPVLLESLWFGRSKQNIKRNVLSQGKKLVLELKDQTELLIFLFWLVLCTKMSM